MLEALVVTWTDHVVFRMLRSLITTVLFISEFRTTASLTAVWLAINRTACQGFFNILLALHTTFVDGLSAVDNKSEL